MKKQLILAASIGLALASGAALANGDAGNGGGQFFVRGEAGQTDLKLSADGSWSDNDTGYSLRGGYFFNRHFGVEGFYSNYYSANGGEYWEDVKFDVDAVGVGAVAKYHFAENLDSGWYVSGRAGAARSKFKFSYNGESESYGETRPYAGVAIGYDFSRNLGLSLNYDYLKTKVDYFDLKLQTVSAGVEYRF